MDRLATWTRRRFLALVGLVVIDPWVLDSMPSLTVSPNPAPVGSTVRVDGSGFDHKKRYELALDGVGYSTNRIGRPAKDGTFHKGMAVSTTPKTQTVTAREQSKTTVVASLQFPVVAAVPDPPPPDPTPVPSGWFGKPYPFTVPFGSYPDAPSGRMTISGDQGGRVIRGLTFRNRRDIAIYLYQARNLVIEDCDFDDFSEGFVEDGCYDITMRRLRFRNCVGPYTRDGGHHGNIMQIFKGGGSAGSRRFTISDLILEQPETASSPTYGTEDIVSLGGLPGTFGGDSWDKPLLIERFAYYGGAWKSPSGTGTFAGDGRGGAYLWFRDFVMYDPGRVGIGTGEEGPMRIERGRIFGNGRGANGIEQRTDRMEYTDVRIGGFGTAWVGGTGLPGYPSGWGTRYQKDGGALKVGSASDFQTTFSSQELAEMRALCRVAP